MILFDTCTFLWLTSDHDQLSLQAKRLITDHVGELFISAISAFEIALKTCKGKIRLPIETEKWFKKALEFHGIEEIPVTASIAIASTQLPSLHRDPCDRIIIATSQLHELTLLTPDSLIKQYSEARIVW